MMYSVSCECGNQLAVTASQAGASLQCGCGRLISVPLLSRLREEAGERAYETSTIDTINRMIREGDLPTGDICAICQNSTRETANVHVQCEVKWMKGPGRGRSLFVLLSVLFFPFRIIWILLGWSLLDEKREEHGHERAVDVPLRLCKQHRHLPYGSLRQALLTVPIYAKLLDEYPGAMIDE